MRKVFIVFSLWICLSEGISQSWKVEYLGTRDGLSSPDVWSIYQDSRNVLWVGTMAGASSYDGQTFTNYSHSKAGKRIGRVKAIEEKNLLWIGSDQGLFYWEFGKFHSTLLTGLTVNALCFSKTGTLWLGCNEGLFYLSSKQLNEIKKGTLVTPVKLPDSHHVFDADERITCLAEKPDGTLLIGTYYFLCQFDGQKLDRIWGEPDKKPDIQAIEIVSDSHFYWACDETNFFQFKKGHIDKVWEGDHLANDIRYKEGNLWLLQNEYLHLIQNGQIEMILEGGTGPDWMRKLCLDREGNIWIGSFEGLIKVYKFPFRLYDKSEYNHINQIYSIHENGNGKLLLGGNRGRLWIKEGEAFIPFLPDGNTVVPQAEIFSVFPQDKKTFWMGTGYQGIAKYTDGDLQRFTTHEGLSDNSRYFFYKDKKGKLWTGGDGGVDQILTDAGGKTTFQGFTYNEHYQTNSYASFYGAIESPAGALWFGTTHGLFHLINGKLIPASLREFPISSLHITDIKQDDQQNIWISTIGEGVLKCRFDPNDQISFLQQFSISEGLPTHAFLRILIDRKGVVWAGSFQGICRFRNEKEDGKTNIRFFDKKDGFPDVSFTSMCLYEDTLGTIWGGTSEGLFSFHPDEVHPNIIPPTVFITEVSLMDGQEHWESYARKQTPLFGLPGEVVLPHHKNFLRFQFTGSSLRKPTDLRFRYRLEGLETAWTPSHNQRSVTYHHLRPGNYRFIVQAINEDGVWSENTAGFPFEIKAAIWNRAWFRLLIILTMGFILYRLSLYLQQKRNLQKEITESKLTALQAQMNPHFIFNSLNSINWYIVKNRPREASQYLTKFSKLVRIILNNSQKLSIPLDHELDALKLYIDLETMRFGDRFTYQIQMDADIEFDEVMIPPLILQPFVENAIWHGLMHKKGKGKLLIQVLHEGDMLKCIIQDNGIGRRASTTLQSGNQKGHQSRGMKLSSDRIKLLHQVYLKEDMVRVIDLEDEKGKSAGTRIEVLLPYE